MYFRWLLVCKGCLQPEIEHSVSPSCDPEFPDDEPATVVGSSAEFEFLEVPEYFSGLPDPPAFPCPGSRWLVSIGKLDSTDGMNDFRNGSNAPKLGNSIVAVSARMVIE